MYFYVLTLFPEMITSGVSHSILKRAAGSGKINVECINIRDFAVNKYGQTDDYPYGGGAGMVMMPQPVYGAYGKAIKDYQVSTGTSEKPKVLYMTPQGKRFTQKKAVELSEERALIILCGHYEGIDERVIEEIAPDEISLGDFVLTGGEIAAIAVIDAVSRLIPGVLGNVSSANDESFSGGLLEYPQYTRPPEFMGRAVPEVLLSGHHGNVDKWRHEQALQRTKQKRPDLL